MHTPEEAEAWLGQAEHFTIEFALLATEHDLNREDQLEAIAYRLGVSLSEVLHQEHGVVAAGSGSQVRLVITRAGAKQLGRAGHAKDIYQIYPVED